MLSLASTPVNGDSLNHIHRFWTFSNELVSDGDFAGGAA